MIVVYYLDGGVVGLVRLDLSIGGLVLDWVCGDVINGGLVVYMRPSAHTRLLP